MNCKYNNSMYSTMPQEESLIDLFLYEEYPEVDVSEETLRDEYEEFLKYEPSWYMRTTTEEERFMFAEATREHLQRRGDII